MDGAKSVTDTLDSPKGCDRQVFREGRSVFERKHGPCENKNPGGSRIIAE